LTAEIQALVEPHSQADPKFPDTTVFYVLDSLKN